MSDAVKKALEEDKQGFARDLCPECGTDVLSHTSKYPTRLQRGNFHICGCTPSKEEAGVAATLILAREVRVAAEQLKNTLWALSRNAGITPTPYDLPEEQPWEEDDEG